MMENVSPGELSSKQTLFVAALLAGHTVLVAAKASGIAEMTAHRWLKDPRVQDAIKQARHQAFDTALSRLMDVTSEAIDTLASVMRDKEAPRGVRIRAAQLLLENAIEVHKMSELEQKIAALSALVEEMENHR